MISSMFVTWYAIISIVYAVPEIDTHRDDHHEITEEIQQLLDDFKKEALEKIIACPVPFDEERLKSSILDEWHPALQEIRARWISVTKQINYMMTLVGNLTQQVYYLEAKMEDVATRVAHDKEDIFDKFSELIIQFEKLDELTTSIDSMLTQITQNHGTEITHYQNLDFDVENIKQKLYLYNKKIRKILKFVKLPKKVTEADMNEFLDTIAQPNW